MQLLSFLRTMYDVFCEVLRSALQIRDVSFWFFSSKYVVFNLIQQVG